MEDHEAHPRTAPTDDDTSDHAPHQGPDQSRVDAQARPGGPLEPLRILAVALQFLTRLPVPQIPVVDGDLRRATGAFPLVGLVVGGVTLAVWAGLDLLLGPVVAAIGAVTVAVAVTGAFHEDGLADTFDGLWGGWDPERRIEIMRDSRVGTYGACALILSLLARVALLAQVDLLVAARAIVLAHVVGRAAILLQIRWLPPVSDRGSGAQVADPVGATGLTIATLTTLATCIVAVGVWTPLILAVALTGTAALRRAARRRIGGLTGDVLGATQQVVLILSLATVVALDRGSLL